MTSIVILTWTRVGCVHVQSLPIAGPGQLARSTYCHTIAVIEVSVLRQEQL